MDNTQANQWLSLHFPPGHAVIDGNGTGAIRDTPDPRDYRYAVKLLDRDLNAGADSDGYTPLYKDFRRRFPPAFDQGRLGSCTANAVGGAIEFLQKLRKQPYEIPSRLSIYYDARKLLNPNYVNEDSGATLRTAIKAVADYGAPPEQHWPYDIRRFTEEPPAELRAEGLLRQAIEYFRIPDGSIAQMEICLTGGFPFVFGIDVSENFDPNSAGVIPMPAGDVLGGHAMLAVGYSRRSRRMLVRNSWGPAFGLHGFIWLPYDYMEQAWDIWTLRAIENPSQ